MNSLKTNNPIGPSGKRYSWDNTTISICRTELNNSPDNFTTAFKRIAEKTAIPQTAVASKWYSGNLKQKVGQIISLNTTKKEHFNKKNSPRKPTSEVILQERVISNDKYDGLRVETIRRYYAV